MPDPAQDHYRTLQVWPEADTEAIEASYRRLSEGADIDADRRQQLDDAYAVLSDPGRRAEYDRERNEPPPSPLPPVPPFPADPADPAPPIAAVETEGEPLSAVPAPPQQGVNRGLLFALLGVVFVALAISAALIAWAVSNNDGNDYPTDRPDGDYNLESMQLRNADLPGGMLTVASLPAPNDEWATAMTAEGEDPAPKQRQLEALGRLRGHRSVYTWEDPSKHAGEAIFLTSLSTLYTNEDAANENMGGTNYCGILVDPADTANKISEFPIGNLGERAVGYQISQPIEISQGVFEQLTETVVCFKTGRILNVVSNTSLSGGADIPLTYRLAERMEQRVGETFDGNPAPLDPSPTPPPGG